MGGRVKIYFKLFRVISLIIILHQALKCSCVGNTTIEVSTPRRTASGRVPIGVVFGKDDSEQIEDPFKTAHKQHMNGYFKSYIIFNVFVDVINTADVFKLSRVVCTQFARGGIALLASVPPASFKTFHSHANTFHVPLLAPYFPENERSTEPGSIDYAMSMLPDYHKAILDTVNFYEWKNVIYLHETGEGFLRLQQLFDSMMPGKKPFFRIANVKKVSNATEVIDYLKQLERSDRWSNKYVILDCTTTLAKDSLIYHVRDPTLGRRNYHYLLTGLVLDDYWEPRVEFRTLNVTGFKLVDTTSKIYKDFLNWSTKKRMSAKGALMYDAAHTMFEAFSRIYVEHKYMINDLMNDTNRQSRVLSCEKNYTVVPLTYGDEIMKYMREIDLQGLTGKIQFSNGMRKNFSLMVVQNSQNSQMIKIATWYDDKGFKPVTKAARTPGRYDPNKIFTILSIQEPPYFTTSRENKPKGTKPGDIEYGGFCVDLALMIAEKLGINVQFRLAADGKFGGENPNVIGGWDGMVGELLRKEADMIIAPMIVTPERQVVLDFSKPFLSFHQMNDKSARGQSNRLFLLRPFSSGIWMLIVGCIIPVSAVMHWVSRCSILVKPANPALGDTISRTTVINEFSFPNSVWYIVSSFVQQRTHTLPKSFSGRIVILAWWFFTLIIVCSYIAKLTCQLTVISIESPSVTTFNRMAQCPEDLNVKIQEITITEKEGYEHMDDTYSYIPPPKDLKKSDSIKQNCEMLVSVVDPGIQDFAIGFPKGSKLRPDVDIALTSIRNEGGLKRILRLYFQSTSFETGIIGGGHELTLDDSGGIFFMLLIGLILALVVAFVENRKARRPCGSADETQAVVSIKTGSDPDSRLQVHQILETHDTTLRRRRSDQDSWNSSNTPGSYAGPLEELQMVAGEYSSITPYSGTSILFAPTPRSQDFQNRLPQTPLRAVTERPVPQLTPRNKSQLNAPFSSRGSTMIEDDNVRCLEVRQGMTRQRSYPVMDEYEKMYFTRKSDGPEAAALRNSYSQI